MNDHEKAFLAALEANEDDEATRLIYADWLEEQGRYEDAERHRKWTASKQWIVNLLAEYGGPAGYDQDFEYVENRDYKKFIEWASSPFDENFDPSVKRLANYYSDYINCGANETLQDHLNFNKVEFFKHLSVVIGIEIPQDYAENFYFSCAC